MIPLHDDVPSRTTPYVNYGIIATCTLVFLLQLTQAGAELVEQLGMIPARVLDTDVVIGVRDFYGRILPESVLADSLVHPWLTPLTCVFLHGGWLHFLGNMWFLWIFGDNVEDCLGHVRYLVFYLVAGIAASLVHLVSGPGSPIPTIGASGAIAGVMGAYMLMYPNARVLTIIPVGIMFTLVLPAYVVLGLWFALQFFQGVAAIGATSSGGVAWWAHIGGFVVGLGFAWRLKRQQRLRVEIQRQRRPVQSGRYYIRR